MVKFGDNLPTSNKRFKQLSFFELQTSLIDDEL
jgi:hypothetical protein